MAGKDFAASVCRLMGWRRAEVRVHGERLARDFGIPPTDTSALLDRIADDLARACPESGNLLDRLASAAEDLALLPPTEDDLRPHVAKLPELQRRIWTHTSRGTPYSEIAVILGMDKQLVLREAARAYAALRMAIFD